MLICLAICCPVCAWGEESGSDQPALPQEVADLADQGQQAQNLWQQGAGELLQSLWQQFSGRVTQPLQLFLRMGLLLVFAAVAAAPASGGDRPFLPLVEMVCFLACAGLCIQPLQQLAEQTRQQILACKSLLLGSVPVLASVLAGGGQPASAAVFSGFFSLGGSGAGRTGRGSGPAFGTDIACAAHGGGGLRICGGGGCRQPGPKNGEMAAGLGFGFVRRPAGGTEYCGRGQRFPGHENR